MESQGLTQMLFRFDFPPPMHTHIDAGGQQTVMEGLNQLAALVVEGGGRISVMPGGGVTEENAATVARVTGEARRG